MSKKQPKQNPLVAKYGSTSRWVAWKMQTVKDKKTKVPYQIDLKNRADSMDPKTWATFEEVVAASPNVGIVFTPDKLLLGIDIDHCIIKDKKSGEYLWDHEQKETIIDFLVQADSYTEVSPSKTGLHIFLTLTAPLELTSHKRAPYEVYNSGRYFTFTGESFRTPRNVRTVTPEQALALLSIIGYPFKATPAPAGDKKPATSGATSSPLDDDEVISHMFRAKNGDAIRALYEGDISQYKDDASSADMALLSHLAFWCAKDAAQMERIWLASPLGKREKTQERQDYRTRSVVAAVTSCKKVFEPTDIKARDPELGLMFKRVGKEKVYIENIENMCRILRKHPRFTARLRFDSFKNIYEIRDLNTDEWRPLKDSDAINIQCEISIFFVGFAKVPKGTVLDAIVKVAEENTYDSAADYIKALVWDGTPRLDTWISTTYHTPDDVYHRAVGANWLKGMIKRIIMPGCKFDYVLVLEGEQGIKKSTSLSILGGSWYVETTMNTDTKDFFLQFAGKAIIEFSEGETLNRTEVKRMKAIITTQVDTFRPPYGRVAVDSPRRCVFAMTTNQDQYLKDETGNRRWLPVACVGTADVEWLRENRDQLFAEAYHRVITKHETIYEFPEEETRAQQAMRQSTDPRFEQIYDWYFTQLANSDREAGITTRGAFELGVHKGTTFGKEMTRMDEMIIGQILRANLQLERRRTMVGGERFYRYYPSEASEKMSPKNTLSPLDKEKVFHDFE